MSGFAEYSNYDGLGLAELVRTGQVTPVELLETAIECIEACNPRLNAVVYKMYDIARAAIEAGLPDGPFKGVPFLLKDLMSMHEGVPTSSGSRLLKDIPMPYDSEMVRRWKAAGVVILGKTNAPEFGITPFTEPELHGPAHNPWDLSRTTGGSSGGSAAVVAARLVPIAGGGDGGGSIRIPASCCGVFGFKPTRARTPLGPDVSEAWNGLAIEHVLTRSVRDSAAMLDATQGTEVGALYTAPPPARPYLQEVTTEPGKLRIAATIEPWMGSTVSDDCVKGMEETCKLLQELGHEVVQDTPKIDGGAFSMAFLTVIMAETRADIEFVCQLAGVKPSPAHFEPMTYAMGLIGQAISASEYTNGVRLLQAAARDVARFMEKYDALLTPTVSIPPFKIGDLQSTPAEIALMKVVNTLHVGGLLHSMGIVKQLAARVFEFIPYTPVFNVTGQPAMSVPLYWNKDGLPIGMQFAGRFGDEATLFRLAGQLERAKPWANRKPTAVSA